MDPGKSGGAVFLCLMIFGGIVNIAAVWKSTCERPTISNGRLMKTARKSSTGHMFKYRCRTGYRRLGNMFNICLRGSWVLNHAVCARRGCATLPAPAGGTARQSLQRDVTTFRCRSEYQLIGGAILYCNGRRWNGTAPLCQGPGARVWTAGERDGRGAARLFSARLPAAASASGCYRFWHRRRRRPLGSDLIRAYALVNDRTAPKGHLRIALRGTDGRRRRQWTERTVHLPDTDAPFEVVIEAVRATGRETDLVLDGVTLMHGDECDVASSALRPPSAGVTRGSHKQMGLVFITCCYEGIGRIRSGILQSPLDAIIQETATQPTENTTSPRDSAVLDLPLSDPALSSPTAPEPTLRPTVALSAANGHVQSIPPPPGTGDWVRGPGKAEVIAGRPLGMARPFAVSSTTPRRDGHGATSEPGSVAGTALFPAQETAPMRGGDEGEDGAVSPAGGDDVSRVKEGRQVSGVVMRDRGGQVSRGSGAGVFSTGSGGSRAGKVDGGEGDDGDSSYSGVGGYGDCQGGDKCRNSVTNTQTDGFASKQVPVSNVSASDLETDEQIAQNPAGPPKMVKPIPTMVDIKTNAFENTMEDLSLKRSDSVPQSARPSDLPTSGLQPSGLSTILLPPHRYSTPTVPRVVPPTSSAPRSGLPDTDETDLIIFPDTIECTSTSDDTRNTIDAETSGAILFQSSPGKANGKIQPTTVSTDLPFYVIIAAAAGGSIILLSTITIVALCRRRQPKTPAVVPGPVFEPEPGDRGPIAELMRQNRLDHQPVVPAPASL